MSYYQDMFHGLGSFLDTNEIKLTSLYTCVFLAIKGTEQALADRPGAIDRALDTISRKHAQQADVCLSHSDNTVNFPSLCALSTFSLQLR